MAECCANNNERDFENFPMSPILIAKEQQKDKKLLRALKTSTKEFGKMMLEDRELITYNKRIVVPERHKGRILAWYHST